MKSIFLSAGHSNSDPGAVAGGWRESDVAVDFRNIVAYYIRAAGVTYVTDGTGQENWPLSRAAAEARKHTLAIEFHCNAASSTRTSGVETLSAPELRGLGKELCEAVSSILHIPNRGAKPENSGQHSRLAFVQSGGILLELLFLTNPGDRQAYNRSKWVVARDVANILMEHIK